MGWKMFMVEMSKAWAWPIAWGIFFLVFRPHLTRIVVTATGALRRIQRFKFGDIEFATGVVQAAVAVSEAKAEAAEQQLSTGELQPQERELLVQQLKEAVAEAERLRAASRTPVVQKAHFAFKLPEAAPMFPPAWVEPLHRLALAIDPQWILSKSQASERNEIRARVRDVVAMSKSSSAPKFLPRELEVLTRAEILEEDGSASEYGVQELVRTAKRLTSARSL